MIDKENKCLALAVAVSMGLLLLCCQVRAEVDCNIVISADSRAEVKAAALDMSSMLKEMIGKEYPVVTDEIPGAKREILVGRNRHLAALKLDIDWEKIGTEGYAIRKSGERLVIVGGPDRGTLNGIYVFLEKYLGCRWYAPDCTVIPPRDTLEFPDIDIEEKPVFEFRGLMVVNANYPTWVARNRGNFFSQDFGSQTRREGKRIYLSWSEFLNKPLIQGVKWEARWHVHTLGHDKLLSTRKYYDEHPEYFSLIGGKRLSENPQPCLTNLDVVAVVAENSKQWIASDPRGGMKDLSLGDYGNMCECSTCAASYAKYGGSGTYLRFVNQTAEIIWKQYPNVLLTTLAYWPVEPPPEGGVRPTDNILVEAGYLQACRYHSLDDCEYNLSHKYLDTLKEWISITPRGVIRWLYTYGHGPQLHRLERTYRLMQDIGLKGFFLCDGSGPKYLQLFDLEQYLHAKLMWDPNVDVWKTIQEFCKAFYGPAGDEMAEYVRVINDESAYAEDPHEPRGMKEFAGFHCQTNPPPLNLKTMKLLDRLFDEAETKIEDGPLCLERLNQARLFLQHNILTYYPQDDKIFTKALRDFPVVAKELGLKRVSNIYVAGGTAQSIDDFVQAMSQPNREDHSN